MRGRHKSVILWVLLIFSSGNWIWDGHAEIPVQQIPETWVSEQSCEQGWFSGSVDWIRDQFTNRLADLQTGIWDGQWRWTPADYASVENVKPTESEFRIYQRNYGTGPIANLSSLVRTRLLQTGLSSQVELDYFAHKNKDRPLDSAQWGNLAWLKHLIRLRAFKIMSGMVESLRILEPQEIRIEKLARQLNIDPSRVDLKGLKSESRTPEILWNHLLFHADRILNSMKNDVASEFTEHYVLDATKRQELNDAIHLNLQNNLRDTIEQIIRLEEEIASWDSVRGPKKKEIQVLMHYLFQDREPRLWGLFFDKDVNRWKHLQELWNAYPDVGKFIEKVTGHTEYARFANREIRYLVERDPSRFKDDFMRSAPAILIQRLPPWEQFVKNSDPGAEINNTRLAIVADLKLQLEAVKSSSPILFTSFPRSNPFWHSTLEKYLRENPKIRTVRTMSLEFNDLIHEAVLKNFNDVQIPALKKLYDDYDQILSLPCNHLVIGPMIYEYENELNQFIKANNYLTHYSHLNLLPKYHKEVTREMGDWKAVEVLSAPLIVGIGYKLLGFGGKIAGNTFRIARIFPNMVGTRILNLSQAFSAAGSRVLAFRALNVASGTLMTTKVISDLPSSYDRMNRAEQEAFVHASIAEESLWAMKYYTELLGLRPKDQQTFETVFRETQEYLLKHSVGQQTQYNHHWWGFYSRVAMAVWSGAYTLNDAAYILKNVKPVADPGAAAEIILTQSNKRIVNLLQAIEVRVREAARATPVATRETAVFSVLEKTLQAKNAVVATRNTLANTFAKIPGVQTASNLVTRARQWLAARRLPNNISNRLLSDANPQVELAPVPVYGREGLKDGAMAEVNLRRTGQIMSLKSPDGRLLVDGGRLQPNVSVEITQSRSLVFKEAGSDKIIYEFVDQAHLPMSVSRGLFQKAVGAGRYDAGVATDGLTFQIASEVRRAYLRKLRHRAFFYVGEGGETAAQAAFRYYLNSPFMIVKDIAYGGLQGAYMVVASTVLTVGGIAALYQSVFSGWILAHIEHLSPITLEKWSFFKLLYDRLLWLQVDQNHRSVLDREVSVHMNYIYIAAEIITAKDQEDQYRNTSALYDSVSALLKNAISVGSDPTLIKTQLIPLMTQILNQNSDRIQLIHDTMKAAFEDQIKVLQHTVDSLDRALKDMREKLAALPQVGPSHRELSEDIEDTEKDRIRAQAALEENIRMNRIFDEGWKTQDKEFRASINQAILDIRDMKLVSDGVLSPETRVRLTSILTDMETVRERRDMYLNRFKKITKMRMDFWAHELLVQIENHDLAIEAVEKYWRKELGDDDAYLQIEREDGQVKSVRMRLFGYEGSYSKVYDTERMNLKDPFNFMGRELYSR